MPEGAGLVAGPGRGGIGTIRPQGRPRPVSRPERLGRDTAVADGDAAGDDHHGAALRAKLDEKAA